MNDVLVIGGGFAGLAAGVELAARGLCPTVLEARPHLGGRAYSFTDAASGEAVDNGQHAMMGCYTHTLSFLDRIGAAGKVVRQADLTVAIAHRDGARGVIAAASLPSPLHMLAGVLGYRLLSARERWMALLGGLRILRMHRAGSDRLADHTVRGLLTAMGQTPNAQAAFWNPVAIATLNELPERAAALPFAAVLARAFFGSRRDSQFVLPGVGLSDLYTEDAARFIEARGGRVDRHAAVVALEMAGDRLTGVRLRDGSRRTADACIAAVPPRALAAFAPSQLAGLPPADAFGSSPIVSVHLWVDRPVLEGEFLGMLGSTTQWLFNRSRLLGLHNGGGQCVSAVISAGHDVVQRDNADIAAAVEADLRAVLPAARGAAVVRSVVVKEKHATISNTPMAERLRPRCQTAIDNLFLAGDWTATGLPPTIESAVLSGHRAAAAVMERLRPPVVAAIAQPIAMRHALAQAASL